MTRSLIRGVKRNGFFSALVTSKYFNLAFCYDIKLILAKLNAPLMVHIFNNIKKTDASCYFVNMLYITVSTVQNVAGVLLNEKRD